MDFRTVKLSIIIPAYNAARYIGKCLRSCEDQDIKKDDYEIIVVDDGSTDDTYERVNKLQQVFPNIVYIYQENARQGAARNNGLRHAKGKYVWYVDADDWIAQNCLGEILHRLEINVLTALAVRHAKYYGEKLILWTAFEENNQKGGKEVLTDEMGLISPTYCIWERSYLITHKLFFLEQIFHEDTEIYSRMYYYADKIGFYNKVCYYIYDSENSTTRSYNPQRAHDVIKVVQSIHDFCKNVKEKEVRIAIRYYICIAINMSLFNTFVLNRKDIRNLDRHWAENKHLFENLLKSHRLKYLIEGVLFKAFPRHVSVVYKIMQFFNPNPGDIQRL